jgi:hypothetical protein
MKIAGLSKARLKTAPSLIAVEAVFGKELVQTKS